MKPHRPAAPARNDRQRRQPPRPRIRLRDAATVEALELRRLLSFSQVGPEFLVNQSIQGDQESPAVAADASGNFVVTWTAFRQDPGLPWPKSNVFARRFGADGEPLSGEFRVDSGITAERHSAAVAVDPDGDFVVTWASFYQRDARGDIYARRYDAAGNPRGDEFLVNQTPNDRQSEPAVATDASGNFVVTWFSSQFQDLVHPGIYARRYAVDGTPLGDEFKVNNLSSQVATPTVAMDADGDFLIIWKSNNQDGSGQGIFARRYDRQGISQPVPAGVPRGNGDEFRINKTTAGDQMQPDVAMDMDGDSVVVWTSYEPNTNGGGNGPNGGVFLQRFTAGGTMAGGEVRINDATARRQNQPHVAMDADGDFLVAWCPYFSYTDGQYVYGKRYSADGTALPPPTAAPPGRAGNEFRVGDHKQQGYPDVARGAAGDAVIVWPSLGHAGTGSAFDVWAQRYDENTDPAGPIVTGVWASGTLVRPDKPVVQAVTELVINFSDALDLSGVADSPLNLANYRLTRDGADVSSLITGITFAFNPQTRKYEATLTLSGALPNGSYVLTVRQALRDLAGNALDGNLDGTPGGGDASVPFVVHVAPPPVLQSITVNGDGSAAQRSQVRSLTLNFDQPVTLAAGAARLVLFNTGGSGASDGSEPTNISSALSAPTSPDGGKTWVFTFSATSAFVEKTPGGASTGSLVDGIYTLSVDPAKVTADGIAMVAPASLTFHRLFGDVDGNQSVNTLDFGLFRNALGKSTGQAGFDPPFDFEGNGSVNTLDYGQFRDRYGKAFMY